MNAAENLGRKVVALGSTDSDTLRTLVRLHPARNRGGRPTLVTEVNDPLFVDAGLRRDRDQGPRCRPGVPHACCPEAVAAAMHCAERLGARGAERLRYRDELRRSARTTTSSVTPEWSSEHVLSGRRDLFESLPLRIVDAPNDLPGPAAPIHMIDVIGGTTRRVRPSQVLEARPNDRNRSLR